MLLRSISMFSSPMPTPAAPVKACHPRFLLLCLRWLKCYVYYKKKVVMLPKKKMSKNRTRTRRSHLAMKPVNYSLCHKCGKAKLPHAMCECGYVNNSLSVKING